MFNQNKNFMKKAKLLVSIKVLHSNIPLDNCKDPKHYKRRNDRKNIITLSLIFPPQNT